MDTVPDRNKFLVETDWLAGRLGTADLAVIDASWHMPQTGRSGRDEFFEAHIPGAVFFDIDAIADQSTGLPHMLPGPAAFAKAAGGLGLGDDMDLVIYDSAGLFSAARVWWMLKIMGGPLVRVLNGGLPKWRAEGRALETGTAKPIQRVFTSRPTLDRVRDMEQMHRHSLAGDAVIVDARAAGRFQGSAPEPRPELPSGHIPGSINLPFTSLVNPDGTLKSTAELADIFKGAGVDIDQPLVTTCGSGVTAAILTLGLSILGARDLALYDGSWSEWGAGDPANIATGA